VYKYIANLNIGVIKMNKSTLTAQYYKEAQKYGDCYDKLAQKLGIKKSTLHNRLAKLRRAGKISGSLNRCNDATMSHNHFINTWMEAYINDHDSKWLRETLNMTANQVKCRKQQIQRERNIKLPSIQWHKYKCKFKDQGADI